MCNPRCSKYALVILNVMFLLLGLGLLIPGILVLVDEKAISDEVLPALQTVSVGATNLGDVAKGLSITLIVFGCFVLLLSFMGACGACCESKCLLVVYSIVVAVLFLGKFVIVILWIAFNAEVQSKLKEEMKNGLKKFSHDDLTTDETSTAWNNLNMNFECCGIDVPATATNDYSQTTWQASSPADQIPISCCTGVTTSSYTKPGTCTNTGGSYSGINQKGCYDAIKDFADKYSIAFICVGVFILLLEVVVILFACSLCKHIGKDQVV